MSYHFKKKHKITIFIKKAKYNEFIYFFLILAINLFFYNDFKKELIFI